MKLRTNAKFKGWQVTIERDCTTGGLTLHIDSPDRALIPIKSFRPANTHQSIGDVGETRVIHFMDISTGCLNQLLLILGRLRRETHLRVGAVQWFHIPKAFGWRLRAALLGKGSSRLVHRLHCVHFQPAQAELVETPIAVM